MHTSALEGDVSSLPQRHTLPRLPHLPSADPRCKLKAKPHNRGKTRKFRTARPHGRTQIASLFQKCGKILTTQTSDLPSPEAADNVVVHEPDRLHERVADRGSHELEAAALQLLAHESRVSGLRGHLAKRRPGVTYRPALHELPDVGGERAVLRLHLAELLRVGHGRLDLQAISHDAGVSHQARAPGSIEPRHLGGIETSERLPVPLALSEDRVPTEARLRALKEQHLEQVSIIAGGHAPLRIVVRHLERRLRRPLTAGSLSTCHSTSLAPARSGFRLFPKIRNAMID